MEINEIKQRHTVAGKHTKTIKLQPKHRELSDGQKTIPWLTVSGKWLEELGFKIGETVRITTREKSLIIEPLEGEAKEQEEYKTALQEVKQTLKKLSQ
ncbi:SymE family type I addiction module toxin [Flavobacterium sp. CS20]|uniref:SymE family type I addiction module toxin n=1 Tax=Flavobacterium sp. CS20 TaxID=2775246 RepID=UPI001B3A5DDB|nr:SymE family type I addiction module toxin [Flavobacterium sp. CS20]QTY27574.1 SymE family type I addiction module toxin [Flavobacterium sp. CS20]QTY27584.1 SymE family type I addiction module toxin [Flavobacterium sp. CS20]